ncbi:MAG: GNAT family N-acetyltransferase [Sphingobacteriaceae bacterium]|nr:MAG: GNAT family N-acetyltransferase [Sphingobacteriaceae bacterium]
MQTAIYVPTKNDYPEMAEVWEASVRATHLFLSEEYLLHIKSLLYEIFDMLKLYCISHNGNITGIMGLSDDKIEMLFIHPDAMGKGLGKKLLLFAVNEKGIKKVDVNEQNEPATAFYKHMGFEVISRAETDSIGKPHPILAMQKP